MKMSSCAGLVAALVSLSIADVVSAAGGEYSPYLEDDFPKNVYFGDTHVHTSYSTDAGMFGATEGPDVAYRFAKGEKVVSSSGVPVRLQRPLDWLVVSDHAENIGLAPMIAESNPQLLKSEWGKQVHDLVKAGKLGEAYAIWGQAVSTKKDPLDDDVLTRSIWERVTEAADAHNEPGRFTAFIGFEWTSTPNGSNLHRNVVFRDNKEKANQVLPFSAYDSENPEDLWRWMAAYEKKTGGQLLALAHNGNLSNGLMFDDVTFDGKALSKDYAQRRNQFEPLYEVTQMKGDGEAHPALSPNDEFADFETWDTGSFQSAKEPGMIEREYAREALKRGLAYQKKLGVNPFKFGMVGSTDSHTALATTTENNFFGKAVPGEPREGNTHRLDEKITGYLPDPKGRDYAIYHVRASAAGLAGVWATENSREAIFDAMRRKEVFATTGTRLKVRFFASWDFEAGDHLNPELAKLGYSKGVPMGSDLNPDPKKRQPKFIVQAEKDADGANLDRIQIVKGWLDKNGKTHEKVVDLICSDGRKVVDDRCDALVGNTVDAKTARYENSIGEAQLVAMWQDAQFDSKQHAFYYVRALEIPTPRWTTYDAVHFGTELPEGVPTSIQERAYTSPIWYSPK